MADGGVVDGTVGGMQPWGRVWVAPLSDEWGRVGACSRGVVCGLRSSPTSIHDASNSLTPRTVRSPHHIRKGSAYLRMPF